MKSKFKVGDRVRVSNKYFPELNGKATIKALGHDIGADLYLVKYDKGMSGYCSECQMVKLVKKKKAPVTPVLTSYDLIDVIMALAKTIDASD